MSVISVACFPFGSSLFIEPVPSFLLVNIAGLAHPAFSHPWVPPSSKRVVHTYRELDRPEGEAE